MLSLLPPHRQYGITLDGRVLATADSLTEAQAYLHFAFQGCVGLWPYLRSLKVVDRHSVEP